MIPTTNITDLSAQIAKDTATLSKYFEANGIPQPSFEIDGPSSIEIPPEAAEAAEAQARLITQTQELHDLVKGPSEMIMGICAENVTNILGLQAVYHFELVRHILLEEKVSYATLSERCGVNVTDLKRLLRRAMLNRIFKEEDGLVSHTCASRLLKDSEHINNVVGIMTEEIFPAASRTIEALDEHKWFREPNQSGFSRANNTDRGLYDELSRHPKRKDRFTGAMDAFAARAPIDNILDAFDWSALNDAGGSVVDIGGGRGPVSIALAQKFPNISFIVQDLPDVFEGGVSVPHDVEDRIKFVPGDLFKESGGLDADVYFLRAILSNWTDDYCVKILKNLVPNLKPGRCIMINNVIAQERSDLPPHVEKFQRSMDLIMTALFGSRDRTVEEFQSLLTAAHSDLKITKVITEGMGVIVAKFEKGEA